MRISDWSSDVCSSDLQRSAACRRLFRPLDDYRTAGCERRRNLADRLIDRKVPRRERRDGTDRLLHDDLVDAFGTGRDDASIGATAFFGEPVDDVGAGEGLPLRLDDGLALLRGHEIGRAHVELQSLM